MGVYDPRGIRSPENPYEPMSEICHKCSQPLDHEKPLVIWSLDGFFLNLHPECSKELALHLAKDGIDAARLAADQASSPGWRLHGPQ